jgi:hypothetical protein
LTRKDDHFREAEVERILSNADARGELLGRLLKSCGVPHADGGNKWYGCQTKVNGEERYLVMMTVTVFNREFKSIKEVKIQKDFSEVREEIVRSIVAYILKEPSVSLEWVRDASIPTKICRQLNTLYRFLVPNATN